MTTVNKSTAECAKFNTDNAEAINLGLIEAIQPNERVLMQEKKELELREKYQTLYAKACAVFILLDPKSTCPKDKYQNDSYFTSEVLGIGCRIEVSSKWDKAGECKLYIGSYFGGQQRWLKIGTETDKFSITAKQIEKARSIIAEIQGVEKEKNERRDKENAANKRREKFLADPACNLLAQVILSTSYIGYGNKITVHEDGRVTFNYDTFTVSQWKEIAALKEQQAAAMKALKESFAK